MSVRIIDPKELPELISGDPGLVCGPGASTFPSIESELYESLATKYRKHVTSSSWLDVADQAIVDGGVVAANVREDVKNFWSLERPEGDTVASVAKAGWSCVISLTPDLVLHKRIKETLDSEPSGWQLTTVTDSSRPILLNTLPFFALMGDYREVAESKRLASSGAEYTARWPCHPLTPNRTSAESGLQLLGGSHVPSVRHHFSSRQHAKTA